MIDKIIEILDKAVVTNISVYDMRAKTPFYDYSIICSVNSHRQGAACVEYLKSDAEKIGLIVRGYNLGMESGWFLVDLNDVVVHIFVGNVRERYNLDGIYAN